MSIYIASLVMLFAFSKLESKQHFTFSALLLISLLLFRGEVGGDYKNYVWRGGYATSNPLEMLANEPLTILFGVIQKSILIDVPISYSLLTLGFILISARKMANKYSILALFTLFIVPISLGYVRQALAVAVLISAIDSYKWKKWLLVFFAILSHPSAMIFAPILFAIDYKKYATNNFIIKVITALLLGVGALIFLQKPLWHYYSSYAGNKEMVSNGAELRISLYVLLYTIMMFGAKSLTSQLKENYLIFVYILFLSIMSLLFFGSTSADRIGIFMIVPLAQVIFKCTDDLPAEVVALISTFYFLIWLHFSPHALAHWQYKII